MHVQVCVAAVACALAGFISFDFRSAYHSWHSAHNKQLETKNNNNTTPN